MNRKIIMKWLTFYLKNPMTLYLKWLVTHLIFRTKYKNIFFYYMSQCNKSKISNNVHIYENCTVNNSTIGEYTYISRYSHINNTTIGRYCSIGPNVLTGPGKHPLDKVSTSPIFYSTKKQVGVTAAEKDTFKEASTIEIGNDVWIGANSIILDGVKIGTGCVIAANSVVTRSIPEYTIAGGSPSKLIRERFTAEMLIKIKESNWWSHPHKKAAQIISQI